MNNNVNEQDLIEALLKEDSVVKGRRRILRSRTLTALRQEEDEFNNSFFQPILLNQWDGQNNHRPDTVVMIEHSETAHSDDESDHSGG